MKTENKKISKKYAWICLTAFLASIAGVGLAPSLLQALRASYELPTWAYPVALLVFIVLALTLALTLPVALRSLRKDS